MGANAINAKGAEWYSYLAEYLQKYQAQLIDILYLKINSWMKERKLTVNEVVGAIV